MSISKFNYLLIIFSFCILVGCGDDMNSCANCETTNEDRKNDSLILVDLYNSTNGTNWDNTWDLNMPMDTWYGITLHMDGTVKLIELQSNGLVGSIPSSINMFTDLIALEIRSSDLTGGIPSGLDQLKNLRFLRLDVNGLSGNIPIEVTNLDKLEVLDLAKNSLTGNIPFGLGALDNMDFLDLAENDLSGNIPADLGDFTFIKYLILRNNDFSGCFPSGLSDLCFGASTISIFPNPKLPYEGDFDKICSGFAEEGAPCNLNGQAGTINADCNCVI